ncbi:unnamed protein product [Eretmochelys imbricata]
MLLDLLAQLRTDPGLLSSDTVLPDLNDELAPVFFLRWLYSAIEYVSDVWDSVFHNNWREMMPLLSLIFSALFILFGTVIVQAFSDSSDERDSPLPQKEEPNEKNEKNDTAFSKENRFLLLTPSSTSQAFSAPPLSCSRGLVGHSLAPTAFPPGREGRLGKGSG